MSKTLNMVGGGAQGLFASIFATGVAQEDTVTLTTPSGNVKSGKWVSNPNPAAHGLPAEYQEVEYIESTGTQYIKTNVFGNYSMDLDFMLTAYTISTGGETLFGSQITNEYRWLSRSWDSPYDQLRYQSWYGSNGNSIKLFGDANLNDRKTITADFYSSGNSLIYNNEVILNNGVGITAVENDSTNVYLFANHTFGNVDGYSCMRLYSSKMRDKNKTLVRDYIPCYRKSDNKAGLYDIINEIFYTNAGTGEFIVGADIPASFDGFLFEKLAVPTTYTLKATRATDGVTDKQDVLVDTAVTYEINIDYKLWLYREGDECEDVTGGWGIMYNLGGTFTKNATNMYYYGNVKDTFNVISTTNKIPLNGYSKLVFDAEVTLSSGTNTVFGAQTFVTGSPNRYDGPDISATYRTVTISRQNIEIDLDTTLDGYIIFRGNSAYSNDARTIIVYKVWLE